MSARNVALLSALVLAAIVGCTGERPQSKIDTAAAACEKLDPGPNADPRLKALCAAIDELAATAGPASSAGAGGDGG